jgi:hypothetical protein
MGNVRFRVKYTKRISMPYTCGFYTFTRIQMIAHTFSWSFLWISNKQKNSEAKITKNLVTV